MGAGCRTLGRTPVRAGTPIRQHVPIALSGPFLGMGVSCWFVTRRLSASRPRPARRCPSPTARAAPAK
eukprot:6610475-Pyramimonas_sp.AAC.1